MGIILSTNAFEEKISFEKRTSAGRAPLLAARGLGSHVVPVGPAILSKLYWSISIPRMLYGLEAYPVNRENMYKLEHGHRMHAKIVQNLPQNTHNPAPLATIGWVSVQSIIELMKILFLWRILCLDGHNIYKRLVISLLRSFMNRGVSAIQHKLSPIANMLQVIRKYGLEEMLQNGIMTGDFGTYSNIKIFIKRLVHTHEHERWRATCILYPELLIYLKSVKHIQVFAWIKHLKGQPQLSNMVGDVLAILMGGQPKRLQRNFEHSICQLCHSNSRDDATHILFECCALADVRQTLWQEVTNHMTPNMINDMMRMQPVDKTQYIISCFNNSYVAEWSVLYTKSLYFVSNIYRCRASKYDDILPITPH